MPRVTTGKRKKLKKPRSKSGCITCRIRRVKCDEARPLCARCLKSGFECDGYVDKAASQRRFLKPRLLERPVLRASLVSADLRFQSQIEYQYFTAFETLVVPHFTGPIESPVWKQIVLQSVVSDDFVRDAVLGIAALYLSLSALQPTSESVLRNNAYAFQQFGKALSSMRLAISTGKLGARKTLIGCFLVFCFEALQGNMDAAISQARSGYRLLHDYRSSPAAALLLEPIEEGLVDAFSRLDLQIITVASIKPEGPQRCADNEDAQVVTPIPAIFSNFDEAQRCWCLVMRQTAKFIVKTTRTAVSKKSFPMQEPLDKEPVSRVAFASSIQMPFREDAVPLASPQEQSIYAKKVSDWQAAFRPFRWDPSFTMNPGAIGLYVHSVAAQIIVDSFLHTNECTIDTFFSEFKTIVSLCKSFFKHNPPSTFSVDIGIMPGLFITSLMCRDRMIRREAIDVLRRHPRREGPWHSQLVAEVGTWVADLEEAGATESGFIPEKARVKLMKVDVDTTTKTAKLVCMRKPTAASEQPKFEHKTVCWG